MSRYISSDWHGQIALANQIMDFLKPEDKLYFLGDAADRGPAGYEIIKMLLSDNRVIYLLGNHEDMLIKCVPEFLKGNFYYRSWWGERNGGKDTWDEIKELSPSAALSLVDTLSKLPKRVDLINERGQNLILTHAGTDPDKDERYWTARGIKDPYLWNRKHIYYPWSGDDNTYVIHGHTVVEYIPNLENLFEEEEKEIPYIPTVKFYCSGHKIDVDMGSFYTGVAALFNLDTFETIYFKTKPVGKWAENNK